MAATIAEHRAGGRHPRVDRTIHLGLLVCMGTNPSFRGRVKPLSAHKVGSAATMVRADALEVWRSFTYREGRTEFHYRFAFEIVRSPSAVPVVSYLPNEDVSPLAEREGLFRDARSTLQEAARLGLENIAIVVPRLSGRPHGSFVSEVAGTRPSEHADEERQRELHARGGLLERTSNAIVYEYHRDLEARARTAAHEVGHLLGLTNASDRASIMGPHDSEAQARSRRFTLEDQRLLHAAIESGVPGLRRAPEAQTSGRQTPHRFEGVLSPGPT